MSTGDLSWCYSKLSRPDLSETSGMYDHLARSAFSESDDMSAHPAVLSKEAVNSAADDAKSKKRSARRNSEPSKASVEGGTASTQS